MTVVDSHALDDVRRQAEDAAHTVLKNCWPDGAIPVDPVQIARKLGVEVFTAQLGNDVIGILSGDEHVAQIYVDEDLPPNLYRFTTAHSLGHYYAAASEGPGPQEIGFVDRRNDEDEGNPDEAYANQFAEALLVPLQALADAVAEDRDASDVALARKFDVPLSAMRTRLACLPVPA
jgi:Zn-dependent peptidase ImmA (M78 family)